MVTAMRGLLLSFIGPIVFALPMSYPCRITLIGDSPSQTASK
jgi:hypothetical protein